MRFPRLLACLFAISLAGLVGCGKSGPQGGGLTAQVDVLDASKLRPAFETAPEETKAQVDKIMTDISTSDLVGAMAKLEALTNAPGITDPQKQVCASLSAQLQKKIAAMTPAQ